MKCEIAAGNVRVFGKAIHALSKIGIELYIEDVPNGLTLKTVNSSRSGYASVLFLTTFFHTYDSTRDVVSGEAEATKCKISLKSCLMIFKSLSTIERLVEKCSLGFEAQSTKFVIHLSCKYGIEKRYELACIESEVLQAVFDKDACTNIIAAPFRLLNDTVLTFQNNQEEVTFSVTKESAIFRSYTEEAPDTIKALHTELRLDNGEFDNYQVEDEVDVTFSLKELRAVLLLADTTDMPIVTYFTIGGRPIIFNTESPHQFEANFVLATLAEENFSANREDDSEVEPLMVPRRQPEPNRNSAQISTVNTGDRRLNGAGSSKRSLPSERLIRDPPSALPLQIPEAASPVTCVDAVLRLGDSGVSDSAKEDAIPESPPSKKYKSLFISRTPQSETQSDVEVLASDTDDSS